MEKKCYHNNNNHIKDVFLYLFCIRVMITNTKLIRLKVVSNNILLLNAKCFKSIDIHNLL